MKHTLRSPLTGRFVAKRSTSADLVEEHNRTIRHARLCRLLDIATSALALAGIVAAYAAFAHAMLEIGGGK